MLLSCFWHYSLTSSGWEVWCFYSWCDGLSASTDTPAFECLFIQLVVYLNHSGPWEWFPPKLASSQVRKYKTDFIILGTYPGFGCDSWGTGHLQMYARINWMNCPAWRKSHDSQKRNSWVKTERKHMYLYLSLFPLEMTSRHWYPIPWTT